MPRLMPCPSCGRHLRTVEPRCPFCGAGELTTGAAGWKLGVVLLGLGITGCTGGSAEQDADKPNEVETAPPPKPDEEAAAQPEPTDTTPPAAGETGAAEPEGTTGEPDEDAPATTAPPADGTSGDGAADDGASTDEPTTPTVKPDKKKTKYGGPRPPAKKKYGGPRPPKDGPKTDPLGEL